MFENRCKEEGISYSRKAMEGKNYLEIVKDVQASDYDLVIIGFLGLGAVNKSRVGSVCERVVRRIKKDVLIAKDNRIPKKIAVGIDGSPNSFGGLKSAIAIARLFNSEVTCIAAFDPNFHYSAFKNIAGVLSDEAGKIFKFKEQEKLHEEIIDKGLAKIYQDHLNIAYNIAKDDGLEIKTELLTGKAFEEILKYVERENPDLLVMGRVGVHAVPELDIGSNTENCFRLAKCNILISGKEYRGKRQGQGVKSMLFTGKGQEADAGITWTKDALDLLEKVPPFAKGIVMQTVNDYAVKKGYKEIDVKVMQEARGQMMGKGKES
ncbi:MAG: universal stress protein [Deltaproteobacteria bacterium]|nr:universal stress protein [Deltaproteobacteria bacterium]